MTRVKGLRPFLQLKPQTGSLQSDPFLFVCLFVFFITSVFVCPSTTVHVHAEVKGQLERVHSLSTMWVPGFTRVLRLVTMAILSAPEPSFKDTWHP